MKVGAIIQARMGSTRLPGKVMKELGEKTVLSHVIERVSQSKTIDEIIVATTDHDIDNLIEEEARKQGVKVFRGSEKDVLKRYYYASKINELDVIVRITSDCPLIDPFIIDKIVSCYLKGKYNLVTNAGSDSSHRTYPRGLDTEVFSFEILEKAFLNAKEDYQREHVTPYIYEHNNKIHYIKNEIDYSKYRWTLDTEDDYELISRIYKKLYKSKHDFYLQDVIDVFKQKPTLFFINKHVEQKDVIKG